MALVKNWAIVALVKNGGGRFVQTIERAILTVQKLPEILPK